MARYNAWMNEKIYQAASGLSDKARKEDRGAFFGSLHGTLNHILWGDLIWLQRFATAEWDAPALEGLSFDPVSSKTIHKTEVFADFAALTAERAVIDEDAAPADPPPIDGAVGVVEEGRPAVFHEGEERSLQTSIVGRRRRVPGDQMIGRDVPR